MKMKLRNKKTEEIGGLNYYDGKIQVVLTSMPLCGNSVLGEYETLTELNTDWEDYTPKEPLIKDEKIRKAIRAWADANEISQAQFDRYTSGFSASDDGHNLLSMISFDGFVFKFVDGKYYTIDELCGEEEE